MRILIVCSDPADRHDLARAAEAARFVPSSAASLGAALASLDDVGAVLIDREAFVEADDDGALSRLDDDGRQVQVLVTTRDDTSVEDAVDLMRRGAFSVLPLPSDDARVAVQIEQALRHRDLALRNAELQRSLDVHERLAMIGKLAAGVAHELNNPLDGVLRFVNLAADSLPKSAPQLPFLLEARRGLRRMADIVRDLLQFSRNAAVEIADEDGERMARDAVAQVAATAPEKQISTAFEFPAGGVALPRAMFQVLANLAKNAIDAMPRGGTLRVGAAVRDGRLHLRVADDGTGIPDEIRDRIFEPFFTTKEVGRGTGLGLSICQRIVERLGGELAIESEPGQGTTAVIELPIRRRGAAQAPIAFAPTGNHVALTARSTE